MDKPYFFLPDLASHLTDIPADSIISRSIYQDDQVKIILFRFATGQELSEHTASIPAIIHILDGEATLTLGADSFQVASGAWAHMEANLPHSILAKTPTTMLLAMVRKKE
ncbi:MAG: cupin domain-containing protein [Chloroflexi bacterium]|nr:cupin domain-containing protein [Chloroflexota bacterium]